MKFDLKSIKEYFINNTADEYDDEDEMILNDLNIIIDEAILLLNSDLKKCC